jgi:hypothetical protein
MAAERHHAHDTLTGLQNQHKRMAARHACITDATHRGDRREAELSMLDSGCGLRGGLVDGGPDEFEGFAQAAGLLGTTDEAYLQRV